MKQTHPRKRHLSLLPALLALVLVSALLLGACGEPAATTPTETKPPTTPAPADTQPSTTPPPAETGPQYGGVLRIIDKPQIQNLGYPGKPQGPSDMTYIRPCCEFLINYDAAGTEEFVPELAESWEWSDDYLHIILKIKQGIKFHDGTPFNAEAVKFNLDLQEGGTRGELKLLESVEVLDEYTLRLNLSGYESSFLGGLAAPAGWMVSPTAIQTMGDDAILHPVGTGPFKFVSYQTDVLLKYEKWEGYWQEEKPYLDGLEFVFIKDPVTQLSSFKAGEAQVISVVTAKDADKLMAEDKYDYEGYPGQLFGLAGDSAHPDSDFADIRVRQAIAYAIDNEAIAKATGFGYYTATNQFAVPGAAWYNPEIVGYPFNLDKARELLDKAGYTDGFDTTIVYNSSDPVQGAMMATIQGYLADVGIRAKLDAADAARFNTITFGGWNNQLVFFWVPAKRGLGPVYYKSFMSAEAFLYTPESLWIPDAFTELFEAIKQEHDYATAITEVKELNKIVIDDYCMAIPIMAPITFRFNTKEVKDLDLFKYDIGGWRPEEAWISK
jgi:ABC-type transport system substrate-binding protein